MSTTKTGIEMIADERARQIEKEGWTPEHDDQYKNNELLRAADTYLWVARMQGEGRTLEEIRDAFDAGRLDDANDFPWDDAWFKPSNDPQRNIQKAGALLAADIDRRNRIKGRS